jgi:RNAse (barnase) inhibitor barstar
MRVAPTEISATTGEPSPYQLVDPVPWRIKGASLCYSLISSTMIGRMKELILNGAEWKTRDDVYDSFFHAVGSPDWHGRNFNALRDSIGTGSINAVEVPYRLVIQNYDKIAPSARQMAADFIDLIRELAAKGCPVEIRVERQ